MLLHDLVGVSRRYGSDPDLVLAGGGNTSYKNQDELWVKASGFSLADIGPDGFAKLSRSKLAAIWDKNYPDDDDAREAAALSDLMAARLPGEETKRPSVETLLHDILPQTWVVHTHPALVNGLSCGKGGQDLCREIFGNSVLWIPLIKPGFILADTVRRELKARTSGSDETGSHVIILQNHGIFVSANTLAEIDRLYETVLGKLRARLTRVPGALTGQNPGRNGAKNDEEYEPAAAHTLAAAISALSGNPCRTLATPDILTFCADRARFEPLSSAYTPDHIVYHGARPLWIESVADLEPVWHDRARSGARAAKVVAVRGTGVFVTAPEGKALANAAALFLDSVKIAIYTESFGGHLFMSDAMIHFIENWEVEKYRAKVSGS